MQLNRAVSVTIPSKEVYFDLLEVESVDTGTLIRAKSRTFARWVKSLEKLDPQPKAITFHTSWKGIKLNLPVSIPRTDQESAYIYSARCGIFYDSQPNMLWLFHGDLAAGWEIVVPEPLSVNNLEDFFTSSIDLLQDLYIAHMRSAKFTAELSETLNESNL